MPAPLSASVLLQIRDAIQGGQLPLADQLIASAWTAAPGHPGLLQARARLAMIRRKPADAQGHLRAALEAQPGNVQLWCDLAEASLLARDPRQARAAAERYHALERGSDRSAIFLASVLLKTRDYEAASVRIREVLRRSPNLFPAHMALSEWQRLTGDPAGSLRTLEGLLATSPNLADLHVRRGLLLLQRGRLQEGFDEYAWRWKLPDWQARSQWLRAPRWEGGSWGPAPMHVVSDEGLGDTLQFARLLPRFASKGPVRLLVQPPLVPLLSAQGWDFPVLSVLEAKETPSCALPVMDLAWKLGLGLEDLRAPVLKAPARSETRSLIADLPGLKVGLVWAGSPSHRDDSIRSLDPEDLAPLADLTHVSWVSLQVGPRAGEASRLPFPCLDVTPALADWADTAALVDGLDALVCVDTATAHLAGAMGKPVHLLLPLASDWRWFLDREDSPWYPGLRIHRQRTAGDWGPPLESLRQAFAPLR